MDVKVLKKFRDKHLGVVYEPGQTISLTRKRVKEVLSKGEFVEKIEPLPEEVVEETETQED